MDKYGELGPVLTRQEAVRLFEALRANQHQLDGCVGPHDFQKFEPTKVLRYRRRCSKCGGQVESLHAAWYDKGVLHGRAAQTKGSLS